MTQCLGGQISYPYPNFFQVEFFYSLNVQVQRRRAFAPSSEMTRSTSSSPSFGAYAASACSFTPSARATFSTVAKLGFPSALSALYRLSRLRPASFAT